MQFDVKEVTDTWVICNLYTPERCIKIYFTVYDYEQLIKDGFFIRDGKERDSANVLNTTLNYLPQ